MGRFAGVENAKVTEGGVYFLPGNYLVEILACKSGETRKKVPFFAVDTKIIESDNPSRPAGSNCSWFVGLDKDAALGNIRGFVAKALESSIEEVNEAVCEIVVGKDQPCAGKKMHINAVNILTKAGKDFTKCNWSLDEDSE